MAVDNKKAKRKPGGGRKKSKPDYNPSAVLQTQIEQAVALYRTEEHPSLQTIADELDLNPIKVRKLLINEFGIQPSEVGGKHYGTHSAEKAENRRGGAADRHFYWIPNEDA